MLVLVVVAAAAVPALMMEEYWQYLAAEVVIYAIAVMGLGVLFGTAGQMSLAQASFMGVGAYTAVIIEARTDYPMFLQLLIVVLVAAVVGLFVGMPAVRVSGLRLALLTLALGQMFEWFVIRTPDLTGGTQGAFVSPISVGALSTINPRDDYLIALGFAVPLTLVVLRLTKSRAGRSMAAVRESEMSARSVGVSLTRTKLFAFTVASVYAAIAGWLLAHHSGSVSPSTFGLFPSVYLLIAVILGGAGSAIGAWLGAVYLILVPVWLTSVGGQELYPLVGGVVLIVLVLLAPRGLLDLVQRSGRGLFMLLKNVGTRG